MHYNEFVHHLFLHKDLDEYLIKYKKFIVTNFQRLIREKILVSFNNIDYVFNYYDDFYYKFFIAKIINEENTVIDTGCRDADVRIRLCAGIDPA